MKTMTIGQAERSGYHAIRDILESIPFAMQSKKDGRSVCLYCTKLVLDCYITGRGADAICTALLGWKVGHKHG
jgi:hypothetical protein